MLQNNLSKNNALHIIILHEAYTPLHFTALYEYGKIYDIVIEDYIVIEPKNIIKTFLKELKKKTHYVKACKNMLYGFFCFFKAFFLKNRILIVGIAPYSYLMNIFSKTFSRNKCVYFTSCEVWDGSECIRGRISNKNRYEEILQKRFKHIACVSNKTQRETQFLGISSTVVYHAINSSSYKIYEYNVNEEKHFIFFGRYIEQKGIDFILRWFKENPKEKVSIDFYGSGLLLEEIQKSAKTDKRIVEKGFCSQEYLKTIIGKYYFSILPTRREPFGMAIIEAMAAGCPTLAADAIGPVEIITNNVDGILFQCENYTDFSTKMKQVINMSDESYIKMKKNALMKAKNYDSNQIIKRWLSILQNTK